MFLAFHDSSVQIVHKGPSYIYIYILQYFCIIMSAVSFWVDRDAIFPLGDVRKEKKLSSMKKCSQCWSQSDQSWLTGLKLLDFDW